MSTDDCIVGICIPGYLEDNKFFQYTHEAISESGYPSATPIGRKMTDLAPRFDELVVQAGWKLKHSWDQNIKFPELELDPDINGILYMEVNLLP